MYELLLGELNMDDVEILYSDEVREMLYQYELELYKSIPLWTEIVFGE